MHWEVHREKRDIAYKGNLDNMIREHCFYFWC